jgi:predicted phosphodiesterase
MRIAVGSDLHLEFGTVELYNTDNADVLVLAGDICVARDIELMGANLHAQRTRAERYLAFFEQVSKEFPKVIYVAGNHEHYNGDFAFTNGILKGALAKFENIHVLEKQTLDIGDVTFIGATLWTNMNDNDPTTLAQVKHMMNDFRGVDNSNRMISRQVPLYDDGEFNIDRKVIGHKIKESPSQFSPQDSVDDHNKALNFIQHVVENDPTRKYVVVGHHCPSKLSCAPRWQHERVMNGAFYSDLDDFIAYRDSIRLWIHGHTHDPFDYFIGQTRVVCNPRGYVGYEKRADYYDVQYVDV